MVKNTKFWEWAKEQKLPMNALIASNKHCLYGYMKDYLITKQKRIKSFNKLFAIEKNRIEKGRY